MIYTVTKVYTDNATLATNSITAYKGDNLAKAITAMRSESYDYIRSDIRAAKGDNLFDKVEHAWHCGDTPHDCPNLEILDTITETAHVAGIGQDVIITLTREYEDEEYADRVASIKDIMRQAYMDAGFTAQEANNRINSDGGNEYVWQTIAQFEEHDDDLAAEMVRFAGEEYAEASND